MKQGMLLLLVLAALACAGCPSPLLTSRYASVEFGALPADSDAVRVSAFVLDVPAAPAKGILFELGPQAQGTLVRELAGKTESIEAFLAALLGGGKEDGEGGGRFDLTRFRKRVVFSVEKKISAAGTGIGPADRVSELKVVLDLPQRARFLSWNRFETKYESVDLGKIGATQSSQVGISATLTPKGSLVPEGIPVGAEFGRGMSEEVLLKQRYVSLSGALAPQEARLYQQGAVGIDLAGNFFIDLDLQFTGEIRTDRVVMVGSLRSKGAWTPAEKIQVEFKTLTYAASPDPVACDLKVDYILRHVLGKDDTIIEGDDLVRFLRGTGKDQFELLRASELRAATYAVRALRLHDGTTSSDGFRLHLAGYREAPLHFAGYSMARAFLDWLKETRPARVGPFTLELDGKLLDVRDIPGLEIEVVSLN